MFNYFEYEEDDYINPFRKIRIRLKEPLILPSVMFLEEVKKIFNCMYLEAVNNLYKDRYTYKSQIRDIAIAEILFSTGMRVSEVCQLKYEDINLRTGVIKIFGKGNKERIIQICQNETLNIIRDYYKLHKKQIKHDQAFFINRLGFQISTQSVRLMIKSYVEKSGLTKSITPHVSRHNKYRFQLIISELRNLICG